MKTDEGPDGSNPFSTRFVRPGALPYLFPPGPKLPQLIDRFLDTGCRGQIIGPHGSGKSCLLATMLPRLREVGFAPAVFSLAEGERRLPSQWQTALRQHDEPGHRPLLVVDGFERMRWLARRQTERYCRREGWGLLVLAHHSLGFPLLYRTTTSIELAQQLVTRLLNDRPSTVEAPLVRQLYERHDGNLRDVLFELYDHYEQRSWRTG